VAPPDPASDWQLRSSGPYGGRVLRITLTALDWAAAMLVLVGLALLVREQRRTLATLGSLARLADEALPDSGDSGRPAVGGLRYEEWLAIVELTQASGRRQAVTLRSGYVVGLGVLCALASSMVFLWWR
jgi:hypothetical protein